MAWLRIILFSTWIRKNMQFIMSGSILFLPPYTRGEKKTIWSELKSNPGPLASQATTLTTIPWFPGHDKILRSRLMGSPVCSKSQFRSRFELGPASCEACVLPLRRLTIDHVKKVRNSKETFSNKNLLKKLKLKKSDSLI